MKYESPYLNKSFRPYLVKRLTLPALGLLLLSVLIGSAFFHQRENYGYRYSDLEFFMDGILGIQYYGWKEFSLTLFWFFLILLITSAAIYHDNKSTKMIIAIEEDYPNKKITIFTKDFLDKVRRINIPLSEFKIQLGGRQKDGLSKHGHICFEFKRKREVMGRYFINYFVWHDEKAIHEILGRLNQPLSNPPRRSPNKNTLEIK